MTERNTGSLNLIEQAVLNRISQGEIKGKIHQLAMPYKELMAFYRCAMMQVETKFNVLNEELSLQYDRNPIETIKTRLKTPESIANKLIKKQVPLTAESIEENISDVAGVRVICSFQSDIYMLADALLKQDDITLQKTERLYRTPKGKRLSQSASDRSNSHLSSRPKEIDEGGSTVPNDFHGLVGQPGTQNPI